MKKAILITAVVALVAGVAGGIWLKTHLDNQAAAAAAAAKPKPSKYDDWPIDPQEVLELVNAERAKVGVAALVMDGRLNASAQEKANDMQERGYWGHTSPDGVKGPSLVFKHTGKLCKYAGENIAAGFSSSGVMQQWMTSDDGHREAILNPKYTMIGVGVAGNVTVQHFCEQR